MKKYIFLFSMVSLTTVLAFQNCGSTKSFMPDDGFGVLGSTTIPICRQISSPEVTPTLKWDWKTELPHSPDPRFPSFDQVMASPVVADLDGDKKPEVVFVAFSKVSTDWFPDSNQAAPHHARNGVLRIVDGATGLTKFAEGSPALAPYPSAAPVIVDIDKDGKAEIFYIRYHNGKLYDLISLNHDGSLRWKYALPQGFSPGANGISAADMNSDGVAEIVAGANVVSEKNKIPFALYKLAGGSLGYGTINVALDPLKPVARSLVAYDGIYNAVGTKVVSFDPSHYAYHMAVADVYPEIKGLEVIASDGSGAVAIYNGLTGQKIKSIDLNDSKYNSVKCASGRVGGGPPSVGDFDGDVTSLEIAIVTGRYLTIFDKDLEIKYQSLTQDCSSLSTGLTSFDLNGDKKPEVLYADEEYFRIYEVTNGKLEVRHKIVNPSGTLNEFPVVADIDGNGSAEILVVANDYPAAHFYADPGEEGDREIALKTTGIRAFTSQARDAWMPTRAIWNQFNFHPDQINNAAQIQLNVQVDPTIYRRNNQGYNLKLQCK